MTGSLYGVVGTTHLTQCFNRGEHIIEEYTSLKDVNLNRIFEGDIIDFTARYKLKGEVPVIYYGGSFGCIVTCIVTNDDGIKDFWDLNHIVQNFYPRIVGTVHDNDLII